MTFNEDNNELSNSKVNLKKTISLFSGCSIIIGTIIGSGLFITSKTVLESSGSPGLSLIIWTLSGLISLVGAYCYTELGTLIQTSGGDYAYINKAYGRMLSFLYTLMIVFVTCPCINAISGITVASYIIQLFFPDCEAPWLASKLIAAVTISFLGFINLFDAKFVSNLQIVFTISKILAICVIIFSGFIKFFLSPVKTTDMVGAWFDNTKFEFGSIALSFHSSLFAYSGWNCLNFLTEELEKPNKNLPRAILISIPAVTIIYLLTNIAYFIVLTPNEILTSETVALTFSEKTLGNFAWLTSLFISFSAFGGLSGSIMTSSRIYYASARDGNLPQVFGIINTKFFTPVTCIVFQTVMSLLMLLVKDLSTLLLYGTFSELFFIGITISTVLYFRIRTEYKDAIRPITVNRAFPVFFLIVCVALSALTLYQYPTETVIGIFFLFLGIPIYYIGVEWKNKPKWLLKKSAALTIFCQKLLICVKED